MADSSKSFSIIPAGFCLLLGVEIKKLDASSRLDRKKLKEALLLEERKYRLTDSEKKVLGVVTDVADIEVERIKDVGDLQKLSSELKKACFWHIYAPGDGFDTYKDQVASSQYNSLVRACGSCNRSLGEGKRLILTFPREGNLNLKVLKFG